MALLSSIIALLLSMYYVNLRTVLRRRAASFLLRFMLGFS
jgi:hypothetical protein